MTEMRKKGMALLLSAWMLLTAGCSQGTPAGTSSVPPESSQVASGSEMAGVTDVVEDGMVPVSGDSLENGTYPVAVDSSSSMFRVVHCELTVLNGEMTAEMTMGGTGYLWVFPGTGEEAAAAPETGLDLLHPAGRRKPCLYRTGRGAGSGTPLRSLQQEK